MKKHFWHEDTQISTASEINTHTCQYLNYFIESMQTHNGPYNKLSNPLPKLSTFKGRAAAGFETKAGGKRGRKTKMCWWGEIEERRTVERGPFWMSSVSLATGPRPQKPLGRTDCLRGARYFVQHHLSLSPHNDSPRSSLLMFVIALSHKGGWSMEPRGASRGQEMPDCCLSI